MDSKGDDQPSDATAADGRGDSGKSFKPAQACDEDAFSVMPATSRSRPIGRPVTAREYEELKKGVASDTSLPEGNPAQEDSSVEEGK